MPKGSGAYGSTLFVADLDPMATEAHVELAFQDVVSTIKSIRVVRDSINQRGIGHAYVNFHGEEDARRAMEAHTPLFVNSNLCRVVPFTARDEFQRPARVAGEGVILRNLDPAVSVEEIYRHFSEFGPLVGCRLGLNDCGASRGIAFLIYASKDDARRAIDTMNGENFHGRKLFVGCNLPHRERVQRNDDSKEEFTNLYIKGIDTRVTEQQFYELFAAIGPVESYSMPLDGYGAPRGFGFVNYKHAEDAVRAVETLNEHKLLDEKIYVARAQQRGAGGASVGMQNVPGTNLYIRNLGADVTDAALQQVFSQYGTVLSAKVMLDEHGASRQFGFVCFENAADAERAIAETNNKAVWGEPLYVAPAQRKDRRQWHRGVHAHVGPQRLAPNQRMLPYMQYGMMGVMPMPLGGQFMPYYNAPWAFTPTGAMSPSGRMDSAPTAAAAAAQGTYPVQMNNLAQKMAGLQLYGAMPDVAETDWIQTMVAPGWSNGKSPPKGSSAKGHAGATGPRTLKRRQQGYKSSLAAAVASAENAAAEKQIIGEELYPHVLKHPSLGHDADVASHVTGILLNQKSDDLLDWIDDKETLNKRIQQACDAYNDWMKQHRNDAKE